MKRLAFALLWMTVGLATPSLGGDVAVSVSVGQPGFYGRIDIGDFPQPQLVYAEPVIIQRVEVVSEPMYLVVPPGHAKHWNKHCARYRACGRPAYFVQQSWYDDVYVPRYQERRRKGSDKHHDNGHGKGRNHD